MDRMSRTLWAVGGLGSIVVMVAGATGFALSGSADAGVPQHVLLALVATMIVSFTHLWAALYLAGMARAIGATAAEGGLPEGAVGAARRLRKPTLLWIAVALALSMTLFVLGGAVTAGSIPVAAHQGLAWGALAAQIAALASERRTIAATERLLRSAVVPAAVPATAGA